ncbi:hypothetical protein HD806DRAFT_534033 [Xylariaceae sp. AK1471]|nr:hypothetical protein HD806DRAFT_534033 [Xylariaceae sp. AK1471]
MLIQETDTARTHSTIHALVEGEVKHYEAHCRAFIDHKQKAVEDIGEKLGELFQFAANVDNIISDCTRESSQFSAELRRRAHAATNHVLQETDHQFSSGGIVRLSTKNENIASLRRHGEQDTPSILGRGAVPMPQPTEEAHERGTIETSAEDGRNPERTHMSQGRIEADDSDTEPMMSRTRLGKRRAEIPLPEEAHSNPQKKIRQAEHRVIHIKDVKDAFIFEYPYNTSLLWIACCSPCDFYAKRNPLVYSQDVMRHWRMSKDHIKIEIQGVLENHVIQGHGKKAWQPRRADAHKYEIPEFMQHLLPQSERSRLPSNSQHNQPRDPQSSSRPSTGEQGFPALTTSVIPPPQQSSENVPQTGNIQGGKDSQGDGFTRLPRPRSLRPPRCSSVSPPARPPIATTSTTPNIVPRALQSPSSYSPTPYSPPHSSSQSVCYSLSGDGGGTWGRSTNNQTLESTPAPAHEGPRDTATYTFFNNHRIRARSPTPAPTHSDTGADDLNHTRTHTYGRPHANPNTTNNRNSSERMRSSYMDSETYRPQHNTTANPATVERTRNNRNHANVHTNYQNSNTIGPNNAPAQAQAQPQPQHHKSSRVGLKKRPNDSINGHSQNHNQTSSILNQIGGRGRDIGRG